MTHLPDDPGSVNHHGTGNARVFGGVQLRGSGVDSTNDSGIFTSSALVVREGDTAPGTGGASFEILGAPDLNNDGDVAFFARVLGSGVTTDNDTAVFTSSGLVAREGDTAPGTDGARFDFDVFFEQVGLNDTGDTAFAALLTGSGVDGTNNRGIFFKDPMDDIDLVLRQGDMFDLGGGDTRRISSFFFNPRVGLSENGLAFALSFDDGSSGIFTATIDRGVGVPPSPVPLPAAGWMLLAALFGIGVLGRRRMA